MASVKSTLSNYNNCRMFEYLLLISCHGVLGLKTAKEIDLVGKSLPGKRISSREHRGWREGEGEGEWETAMGLRKHTEGRILFQSISLTPSLAFRTPARSHQDSIEQNERDVKGWDEETAKEAY